MWCKSWTDELILLICHSSASITESSIFWNTETKKLHWVHPNKSCSPSISFLRYQEDFITIHHLCGPPTIPFLRLCKKMIIHHLLTVTVNPRHDVTTLLRIRAIMARHQSWRCKVALLGISSIRILQNKYHQISLWHHILLPFDHRIQAVKNEAASCNHKRSFKNIVHSSVCVCVALPSFTIKHRLFFNFQADFFCHLASHTSL